MKLGRRIAAFCFLTALTVFAVCTLSPTSLLQGDVAVRSVDVQTMQDVVVEQQSNSTGICLTPACIHDLATHFARPFAPRLNQTWCLLEPESEAHGKKGIILVKVPKAGSSTAAGAVMRVGHRLGCKIVHWEHHDNTDYADAERDNSFLLAPLRDPAERALSRLWFSELSRHSHSLEEDHLGPHMIEWLQTRTSYQHGTVSDGQGGFQIRYASLHEIDEWSAWRPEQPHVVYNVSSIIEHVRKITERYDLLLLSERMDESLVILSFLMGLEVSDILVVPSKHSGQNWYYSRSKNECWPMVKGKTPAIVYAYLSSDEWRAANYGDYLLHSLVNQSLDLTIDSIGRERFDASMLEYQRLKKSVLEVCSDRVHYPCSNEGEPQTDLSELDCYNKWHDDGCGYPCVDAVIEQEGQRL